MFCPPAGPFAFSQKARPTDNIMATLTCHGLLLTRGSTRSRRERWQERQGCPHRCVGGTAGVGRPSPPASSPRTPSWCRRAGWIRARRTRSTPGERLQAPDCGNEYFNLVFIRLERAVLALALTILGVKHTCETWVSSTKMLPRVLPARKKVLPGPRAKSRLDYCCANNTVLYCIQYYGKT